MRDAVTLPLIRAAIAAGLPLLAICRGLQELNVALGGTLHQRLQDLPGRHRPFDADRAVTTGAAPARRMPCAWCQEAGCTGWPARVRSQ